MAKPADNLRTVATVNEILNFELTSMARNLVMQPSPYGAVSLFFVPCGECQNPMHVASPRPESINEFTEMLFECAACGSKSAMEKLTFTETEFITIEANEFNSNTRTTISMEKTCPQCSNAVSEKTGLMYECCACGHKWN